MDPENDEYIQNIFQNNLEKASMEIRLGDEDDKL